MFAYGQTAANAIAVMSYLAAERSRRVGSAEIAASRGISKALTAKLLTQLASARFVTGQRGPGGGYTLARDPREISLFDIASLFEQIEPPITCPFGPGWCGTGARCPMHDAIHELISANDRFLRGTNLSVFLNGAGAFPAVDACRREPGADLAAMNHHEPSGSQPSRNA